MGTISLPQKRITTFFGLKDVAERLPVVELNLERNELESFEHFGTHPDLQVLHLEDNCISSFLGMTKQKSLHSLFLRGCPVASQPHYRVMALLTVGFSLKSIDGKSVDASEREIARKLGPSAALAVSYGWLLDTTPRSAADYDKIIVEIRKTRKSLAPEGGKLNVRTIPMVLAASTAEAHDRDGLSVTAETVELQNRALLHFAKRVAQLEQIVMDLQHALSSQQPSRTTNTHTSSQAPQDLQAVTTSELCAASLIVFTQGITIGGLHSSTLQCVVCLTAETIEMQNFFTRSCVAEVRYRDISTCRLQHDMVGKMILGTRDGLTLDVSFRDLSAYSATVKMLKARCPGVVPPIPKSVECDPDGPHQMVAAPAGAPPVPVALTAPCEATAASSEATLVAQADSTVLGVQSAQHDELNAGSTRSDSPEVLDTSTAHRATEESAFVAVAKDEPTSSTSSRVTVSKSNLESKSVPAVPEVIPPAEIAVERRNPQRQRQPSLDVDSDPSPPRPLPKRSAWRGKEIRELMINSSDSD